MIFHPSYKRTLYKDRIDAGKKLAKRLIVYKDEHPIILALPRGGVVIGYEVAKTLAAPLDVIIARKIGAPHNPEFGIGAIAEGNTIVLDVPTMHTFGYSEKEIKLIEQEEEKELIRRVLLYRGNRPFPHLSDKTIILVDDGLATGVTALAAIETIRKFKPKFLIFAVPVCVYETGSAIASKVDEFICLASPHALQAIGLYYDNFEQVSDEEVIHLLSMRTTQ